MALSETWLSEHHDAEIHIQGYSLFRQDRTQTKGKRGRNSGGVAVYVRDDAASNTEIIFTFSNGVIEALGIHIKTWNLAVVIVYRTPDDPKHNRKSAEKEFSQFLKAARDCLKKLPAPTPDIILCGDFNLPNADWNSGECRSGASRVREEQKMVSALYSFAVDNFLVQQIEQPTHRDGNILDLLFTNNSDLVHSYTSTYSGQSDHKVVEVRSHYKTEAPLEETSVKREPTGDNASFFDLNFFSDDIDWTGLNATLEDYDWSLDFKGLNPNDMFNKFFSVCLSVATDYVPQRRRPRKSGCRIPRHRRVLMRTRRTQSGPRRQALIKKLVKIEKDLKESHRNQQEVQEQKAVNNIKKNSKYFLSYAKSLSKVKVGIGPLINSSKSLVSNARMMAEILSDQYSSVFSQPRHEKNDPKELFPDTLPHNRDISDVLFTEDELIEAMNDVSSNSAAGPDGFPAMFLKQCSRSLAHPLFMIWRHSLNTGTVPEKCKFANIIPIHKGKSRAEPKNYRPVALTSLLIKAFEKVIRQHLVTHMEDNHLFNPFQHGFRKGRSCLSQLLAHFDHITRLMEEGKAIDIVYLDFSKAFDKVDIGVTLRKLKLIGIHGRLGRWLHNFLTGRLQAVVVNGIRSTPRQVLSGVPQGSVLGPLLFLVLIGDIDQDIATSFLSSFADDTRLGHGISNEEDVHALQHDLQTVYDWARKNNMEFNSEKFEILQYQARGSNLDVPSYYSEDGLMIPKKTAVRDLGITMSNDASFSIYINEKVAAMNSKISWVLRSFKTRDRLPMLTLWKQLILSDHDYCSQLWSPDKVGDIQSLELLQRSYLRKIHGMQSLSYWDQLQQLGLYSLERRRERYIATYEWKILEGIVPNISDDHGISAQKHPRRGRECRVPKVSTSAPSRIQTIRFSSFAVKGPRIFNSLPKHLRNFTGGTVDNFKHRLDVYLQNIPDEPLIPGYTAFRTVNSNSIIAWSAHLAHLAQHHLDDPATDISWQAERGDLTGSP